MKAIFFLFATLYTFPLLAQVTGEVREFLLANYISDVRICSYCNKQQYIRGAELIFETGEVWCSPKLTMRRKAMKHEQYISDSIDYNIQFYKIQGYQNVGHLYIVHLIDGISRGIDVWIRVRGWQENDMRFLYLLYKKNGLRKNDFERMVLSWINADSIAQEVQFEKVVVGAIKNKMEDDCFISEHSKILDGCRLYSSKIICNKDLYSVFSRQPLEGSWLVF